MRLNAKTAKELREVAGYRNEAKTPRVLPFPGIAKKMYQHPVYEQRETRESSYERKGGKWVKVWRTVKKMVLRGKTPVMVLDEKGWPKLNLVPVTNPARIGDCPKGTYRTLKKLAKRGQLKALGARIDAMSEAQLETTVNNIKGALNANQTHTS